MVIIEIINKTLFHWLFTAPLLYRPMDWLMCIGQITLLRLNYKLIKERIKKNGRYKRFRKSKRI